MHGAFFCLDDVESVACRTAAAEAEEQVDGNQAFYPKSVDFVPPQITLVDRNQRVKKEFASIPVWHPECYPRTLHQTCLTAALPESARLPPPPLPHRLLATRCKSWWPQTPTSPHVSQATAGPAQKET